MYDSPPRVEQRAKDTADTRPYVMIEYSHAMGNSNGNFKKYWDIVRRYDVLQGGWIWDFVDQSLSWPTPARKLLTESGPGALRGEILARAAAPSTATRASPAAPSSPATSGLDLTGSLTLEAWVTPHVTGYHQPIIAKGDTQYALKQSGQDPGVLHLRRRPVDHRELGPARTTGPAASTTSPVSSTRTRAR